MGKNPLSDPHPQPGSYSNPIIADSDDPSDVTIPTPKLHANDYFEVEPPHWLPPGWRVKGKVRVSNGQTDKYYFDPGSKLRFRSKKEVLTFLQTGEIGSGKKKLDGSDVETTPQRKKRKTTTPKASIENFNFNDVPAKVKWVMPDMCKPSWYALVDFKMVPTGTQLEWAAAYKHLATQKVNNPSVAKENHLNA